MYEIGLVAMLTLIAGVALTATAFALAVWTLFHNPEREDSQ